MLSCSVGARVFIAQGINPTAFLPFPPTGRKPAGTEGFLLGGKDALANCVMA